MSETRTVRPGEHDDDRNATTTTTEAAEPAGPAAASPGPPPPSGPSSLGRRLLQGAAVIAVAILVAVLFGGEPAPGVEHHGFPSVLPALFTLVLVFVTREVISSLFVGIVVGGLVSGNLNIAEQYLIPAIGTESFAVILLVYLWALGGLIGLWTRSGGAQHFAEWAGRRIVRGPKTAKFFAWLMGMVFHQGGTISTVLAGTTVRPVTDAEKVSHEEVAYLVDSTASPAATIIPLNAWPLYVGGLVAGTTPLFATEQEAVSFFFQAVPFNFYGIFAVALTFLFAWELLPWEGGRMRAARRRARDTGQLDSGHAQPLAAEELTELKVTEGYRTGIDDFIVPLGVLIGVALTGVVPGLLAGDLSAIDVPIAEAFGLSVLSAIGLALFKGMPLKEALDGFVDGVKGVSIGAIILALAVTLGEVSQSLGTAAYIVETTADIVIPALLPALFLAINMAVAFSVGSSWGTYAVVFPIAMPLAYAVNPDPFYVTLCFGAVLGGAVFGDQCSPISDTTILSSLATGSDLMDHVFTQLPLAVAAATIGGILYTLLAIFAV
ncbi:MAG: Na+/H+ antiporter NhaC family protein [Gemmatimonadota bacterium]